MKMKNLANQSQLLDYLRSAEGYRWKGGEGACYEIFDNTGQILFGKIWSEDQAVAILTLSEIIQGKINVEELELQ